MYWKFTDPWEIKDLMALYNRGQLYLDQAEKTVHTLIDFEEARRLPANALSARHTSTWNHPRSGQMAVAGGSTLIRAMLDVIFKLVHFERIKFFEHVTDARAYLHQLIEQEHAQPES